MSDQTKYNVEVSAVEIYRFRPVELVKSGEWADITIDTQPGSHAGRISINSGFGAWAYSWKSCGESFKQFLCGLDKGYVAKNFGCHQYFDAAATIEAYRKLCAEYYRYSGDDFEYTMKRIAELEDGNIRKEEFIYFLSSEKGREIMYMYDGAPDLCTTIDPQFVAFWECIWPAMVEQFKKEENEPTPMNFQLNFDLYRLAELCNFTFSISYNPHKDDFESVEQYIEKIKIFGPVDEEDIPQDILQHMIKTNTIISIHYYPDNSVGQYALWHYDIGQAITKMLGIIEKYRAEK